MPLGTASAQWVTFLADALTQTLASPRLPLRRITTARTGRTRVCDNALRRDMDAAYIL